MVSLTGVARPHAPDAAWLSIALFSSSMVIPVTTPFLRRSSYALLCLLLMMSLASCDIISKDDPCGPNNHGFERFNNSSLFGINEPTHTYIESGNRVYQWSTPFYENICPEEHINVSVTFQLATNPLLPVETRVKGDYAIFFEPGIPFEKKNINGDSDFRHHKGDFGIMNAFDKIPGRLE